MGRYPTHRVASRSMHSLGHRQSSNMQSTALNLPEPAPERYSSPKRKRETEDTEGPQHGAMRLRTDLPSRTVENAFPDPSSPRTKVSDQLQSLRILDGHIPLLEFNKHDTRLSGAQDGDTQRNELGFGDIILPDRGSAASVPLINPTIFEAGPLSAAISSSSELNLQPPHAPTIKPTVPTEPAARTISPLPITSAKLPPAALPRKGTPPPTAESHSLPHSLSPTSSPPPSISDLVWQESEITGHNPTDPLDDGEGINGIGFRPTPAMAQARSRRRKQQVAEWRSREAKESRQKRLERRAGITKDVGKTLQGTERKVRFLETS